MLTAHSQSNCPMQANKRVLEQEDRPVSSLINTKERRLLSLEEQVLEQIQLAKSDRYYMRKCQVFNFVLDKRNLGLLEWALGYHVDRDGMDCAIQQFSVAKFAKLFQFPDPSAAIVAVCKILPPITFSVWNMLLEDWKLPHTAAANALRALIEEKIVPENLQQLRVFQPLHHVASRFQFITSTAHVFFNPVAVEVLLHKKLLPEDVTRIVSRALRVGRWGLATQLLRARYCGGRCRICICKPTNASDAGKLADLLETFPMLKVQLPNGWSQLLLQYPMLFKFREQFCDYSDKQMWRAIVWTYQGHDEEIPAHIGPHQVMKIAEKDIPMCVLKWLCNYFDPESTYTFYFLGQHFCNATVTGADLKKIIPVLREFGPHSIQFFKLMLEDIGKGEVRLNSMHVFNDEELLAYLQSRGIQVFDSESTLDNFAK